MSDELRPATSSILKSCQDMERLTRSIVRPHESAIAQMMRSMEPIWRQHQDITRLASQFAKMDTGVAAILRANDHWRTMIDQATAPSRMLADAARAHTSWLKSFHPMQDQLAQLRAATQLSIGSVACRLTVTERAFAGLDLRAMTRLTSLAEPSQVLRDSIAQMTARYASLAESIHSYPDFTRLPSFTVPGATRELFVTGYALETRFPPVDQDEEAEACQAEMVIEVEQETSVCVSLLQSLDPALARPYLGARQALDASNPDRVRHILVSLRELWNHVLHRLAPDSDVLAWIPLEAKDLLHEGRPTRRARALYICRDLNHPPLADFLDQDTKALVKLVEFFNRVHELDSPITEKQLCAILLRTESWLTYILQLREA